MPSDSCGISRRFALLPAGIPASDFLQNGFTQHLIVRFLMPAFLGLSDRARNRSAFRFLETHSELSDSMGASAQAASTAQLTN